MATVKCIFAANLNIKKSYSCGMHSHPCTEIVYYRTGYGNLKWENKPPRRYQPGSISIYQPGHKHCDSPEHDGVQICLGVSGCGAEKLPEGMWIADQNIINCIENTIPEIQAEHSSQERLDILCGWLVLELRRFIGSKNTQDSAVDRISTIKQILDSRFDKQIDLQQLAGEFYMNPDYLRHIFKQSTGESPLNYLIRRRLDAACELLNFSDLPIGDIASRVGLGNAYYFSRIFRKRLGVTPTQFRKDSKNKSGKF